MWDEGEGGVCHDPFMFYVCMSWSFCVIMTSSNGNIFCVTGLCAGNLSVTGELATQRPVTRRFEIFFEMRLNKRLCEAGDLRRHRAHYDVIVILVWQQKWICESSRRAYLHPSMCPSSAIHLTMTMFNKNASYRQKAIFRCMFSERSFVNGTFAPQHLPRFAKM